MKVLLVSFIFLSLLITAIYFMLTKSDGKLEKRKQQSSNRYRENILRKRLDKLAESRVKYSKRYEIESLCLQAGLKLQFVEYLVISIASSILFAVIMIIVMKNVILGILFLVIGYMVPKQLITFVKNRRVSIMEKQIGSFMLMVLKRYENTKDFKTSLELTMKEFKGEDPLYSEIKLAVMDINLGKPVSEALEQMARRTGNKYMVRLADYYKIASDIGTDEIKKKLLYQAYLQYEENRRGKSMMKRELANVKREAYIMLGAVPMFALFQMNTSDDYIRFMTEEPMGQIGTLVVFIVLAGSVWFINNKISAPLD